MNKWIKYIILFLMISKITFSGILLNMDNKGSSIDPVLNFASAEENEDASSVGERKDTKSDETKNETFSNQEIEILTSLEKRRLELSHKEEEIRKGEERLNKIRQEISNKILELRNIEAKIEKLIEIKETVESKSLDHLAKVYEATTPEQAGPMMSKLDVKLAANILMRISGRKAGKIWAFVDPAQAVKISEELAKKDD